MTATTPCPAQQKQPCPLHRSAARTEGVCGWRKFYWDTATLTHSAVQGRLYATPAQLCSCDRDPLS